MMKEILGDKLIQNTDRYPIIYQELEKLLKKQHFVRQISKLSYIKQFFIDFPVKLENALEFLAVFEKSFIKVLLSAKRTKFYGQFGVNQTKGFLKEALDFYRIYKLSKYVKQFGFTLPDILRQIITHENHNFGRKVFIELDIILPDSEYDIYDKEIISYFDKEIGFNFFNLRKTNYYKIQRSKRGKTIFKTLKHIKKYFNLYLSIKQNGYKIDKNNLKHFPWIFCSNKTAIRIDGHHRCGVLKFLKHREVPALLIIPSEILSRDDISDSLRKAMQDHQNPNQKFEDYF